MKMSVMTANCAQRLVTMTLRLEKRSETQPAVGAKRTKGRMMMAARIVLIVLAVAAALSAFFGKNSGATAAPSASCRKARFWSQAPSIPSF
jgi:hypothetical protein